MSENKHFMPLSLSISPFLHSGYHKTIGKPHKENRTHPNIVWKSCTRGFRGQNYWKRGALFLWSVLFVIGWKYPWNSSRTLSIRSPKNHWFGSSFAGPALVFEGEESMIAAISEDPMSFKVSLLVIVTNQLSRIITFMVLCDRSLDKYQTGVHWFSIVILSYDCFTVRNIIVKLKSGISDV